MLRTSTIAFSFAALLPGALVAQGCQVNLHPLAMVDANGVAAPVFQAQWEPYAQFATEAVYMSFAADTPSGTYYVHVTDVLGSGSADVVLSTNDPMDRFVTVQNDNGVISLSLPFTANPSPDKFGIGLGGVGQSLRLSPFSSAPHAPCEFAVWVSDVWELHSGPEWPYIARYGFNVQLGRCAVASYHIFRVGDAIADGSDIAGTVFLDADRDGALDAGEQGVGNFEVRLVGGTSTIVTTTDASGAYQFVDVPAGSYSIEVVGGNGYVVTGNNALAVEVCACGDLAGKDFGVAGAILACEPRPRCFWIGWSGRQIVNQVGVIPTLPALNLRSMGGQQVAPGNALSLACYLAFTNSWNMAYRLSAELAVMHCNVLSGLVDPLCVVNDPVLGQMTVADLMAASIASLAAHPLTPWWSQHRLEQRNLKNALLNANENRNWQ